METSTFGLLEGFSEMSLGETQDIGMKESQSLSQNAP